ncbi:MAG: Na+/H+ antiporter NhaA [Zoogloeaceae bacterium]|nr:Na+/H+ antiporter NhaA [Rhodocyclaceae bacterium]MCP5237915.1 Na+/H+ antiporter NhaA [Zoogloeaceae bacterium]
MISSIRNFLRLEAAGGLLLIASAVLAMAVVNTPLRPLYDSLLATPLEWRFGDFEIAKPLLLWINDGLMAVFFFMVGLEIKREVLEGELSRPSQIALPGIAAIGGMVVPASIFWAINAGDAHAMTGWAIPTATDIAFALGMLSLFGDRVPVSLKVFLLTLAIIDDLGAIVIIALFYTSQISLASLAVAAGSLVALAAMNRRGVLRISPYLLVGAVLWTSMLKSGVHATLAGVLLAFFIPLRTPASERPAPLTRLEDDLHTPVAFGILPLFAFANAGIPFDGMNLAAMTAGLPLGVALGLFLGKPLGIFGFSWLAVRSGLARLPDGVGWRAIFGVSILCGIGFTMSLFIASLAFESSSQDIMAASRIGIVAGTAASALLGLLVLKLALPAGRAERGTGERLPIQPGT